MLLELRLFSLLDLLLDASQRLGCSLVGLGSVAQPGVDLIGVVWFYRSESDSPLSSPPCKDDQSPSTSRPCDARAARSVRACSEDRRPNTRYSSLKLPCFTTHVLYLVGAVERSAKRSTRK